jgi:ABC-type multidrug transport system fused ATPase/permease subunit
VTGRFTFRLPHLGVLRHIGRCIRLLSPGSKIRYFLIVFSQGIISLLDLIGLALIMSVVSNLQDSSTGTLSPTIVSIPVLGQWISGLEIYTSLLLIVGIFVIKSISALLLHTATIRLMATETLRLVENIGKTVFEKRTSRFRNLTNQDISYTLYNASDMVFRDTLVPVSVISADFFLLLVIGANLYASAPDLFVPTTLYFLIFFVTLRTIERRSNQKSFRNQMRQEIVGRSLIQETTSSLRELYVSSQLNWMISRIFEARTQGTRAGVTILVGQLRPKYFYEIALYGGIGVIAFAAMLSGDSGNVVFYLTLFLVSASRLIPSLLRIQYYLGVFQKSRDQTVKVFEIFEMVRPGEKPLNFVDDFRTSQKAISEFSPDIQIDGVSFSYGEVSSRQTIQSISMIIGKGEFVAIVGPSGAGKSTLLDLVLGYQEPSFGEVLISGLPPRECFKNWPGSVAYVPQKVTIYKGSLFANVAIGNSVMLEKSEGARVKHLLEEVGLGGFLENLDNGLDTELSEMGSNLSGGQIQRIGIARALFTDPSVLVFDESTSSLDSASEDEIMKYLLSFKGLKTMIFIAHRLSTIRTADRIIYLNDGKVVAEGDFESLQRSVPEFKQQVLLLNVDSGHVTG